jgi:hypothetical protein
MNKQSENSATITNTIEKSEQTSLASAKDEFSEQELEKASGGGGAFLRFDLKSVSVKTISWGPPSTEAPKEGITFEYEGLKVRY